MNGVDRMAIQQIMESGALDEIFEEIRQRYYQQWTDDTDTKSQFTLHAKAGALKDLKAQFKRAAQ